MTKSLSIQIGSRFGAWVVIDGPVREKRGEGRNANYLILYPCRCDCGTERKVRAFKLLSNSRSCGCLTNMLRTVVQHGQDRLGKRTHLYRVWDGMRQRCSNPNHQSYAHYGGRGIHVCDEWHSFISFAEWASSHGYDEAKEIDRIDNDRGYEPLNCRWVTPAENKRNLSVNHWITAFGETKCITDWALDPRCGVTPPGLLNRIEVQKMSAEDAITTPRKSRKSSPKFTGNHVMKHHE